MPGQGYSNGSANPSRLRRALKTILVRTDDGTTIEECRRCGTTLESTVSCCPSCGRDDIVTYRIN